MRILDDKIKRKLFFYHLQVTVNKHLIPYYDSLDRTIYLNINILFLNNKLVVTNCYLYKFIS